MLHSTRIKASKYPLLCSAAHGIVTPAPACSAILLVTFDLPRKNDNYIFPRAVDWKRKPNICIKMNVCALIM